MVKQDDWPTFSNEFAIDSLHTSSTFTQMILQDGTYVKETTTTFGITSSLLGFNTSAVSEKGLTVVLGDGFSSSVDVFIVMSGKQTLQNFNITLNRTLGSGCGLFKITSSGSLNMSNMVISGGSISSSNDSPFMSIGSGSIKCYNVTFDHIKRLNRDGSLFELKEDSKSDVTLSGMTFNSCVCQNGSGGAVSCVIGNGKSVTLSNLSFTSCTASGVGGGIYVKSNVSTSTLKLLSTTFTSCECQSVTYGMNVFIEASSADTLLIPSHWKGTIDSYHASDITLYWVNGTLSSGVSINMSVILPL